MSAVDRQQVLAALLLLAMALFVSSGYPGAARWRRELKIATIVLFLLAVLATLIEIAMWWSERS